MAQDEAGVADREAADRRRMMVDGQVRTFDVTDQRVLDAFYRTPRETSLPPHLAPLAYSDAQLVLPPTEPGQEGRALMQPMFLAKLLQGATLAPQHRVMVVAGGPGYVAALVRPLVASVVTLDSDSVLSAAATAYLNGRGLHRDVTVVTGPLAAGHKAGGPYDCIVVHGGVETNLDTLFAQLAPGGCLVTIEMMGDRATRRAGKAVRFDNIGGDISRRNLFDATVPVLPVFRVAESFVF